ncbi:hypothetical protein KVR01_008549 [Diaporthe batatas]|uniref:uncharacterized protein n=1 Tax=Diaporthe batatas TaxID=748121 RepID=UPI001D03C2F4|nr:uncharacterized protein KVR01_008549 [Diaporthe batatas]KAG8161562.1 hypothetical protein KVR01_008549 [Diaporthe batatas]
MEATTLNGSSISVPGPSSDGQIPVRQNQVPITIGTSTEYQHRLSDISARATTQDRLNTLFQWEKTGPSVPFTVDQQYEACMIRIRSKIAGGAFIVEAAGFAAVACWQPPGSVPPDRTEEQLEELSQRTPIYAKFLKEYEETRRGLFGESQQFWFLTLMARDPERLDKGAVRAVLEPFVAEARSKGQPLWLVAGNQRARDVYSYFGFRVVKVLMSYPTDRMKAEGVLSEKDMEGVPTWCMAANWPVAEVN